MKRKLLALLLAMALAFSAVLPLSVPALAANDVTIALYATGVAHYKEENFSKLPAGVTATVDSGNKVVYLRLNNYNGDAIYVVTPSKKWAVFASITGSCTLKVFKSPDTGRYHALGTNGGLLVYASGGDASLTIDGNFSGTMVDADYYALYGDSIGVGSSSGERLNLNINFNLVVSQYSNKDVYPVNEQLTINSASVAYHYASGQENPHPEEGIKLTGSAYFYVYYNAKGAKDRSARAFWGLEYDKNFTGVVYMNVINGYHYGGAYSYEKFNCELAPRYRTYIGDTEYYYVAAKNCQFPQNPMDETVLKDALSFPVDVGYTFPDRISASGFDASVEWEDEDGNDVTGKKAEYGVHYTVYVTPVPWGTIRFPALTVEYLVGVLKPVPTYRYSTGVEESGSAVMANSVRLRYYIPQPNTVITKQPVDYYGSGTDKNARFTVETSGTVTAYQWQMSDSGTGGWTNVTDKTIMSSTPITGAKTKALNYNFVYEPEVTRRYFRCMITGSKNDAAVVLYTNVVKYEYANKISGVSINTNALPVHKQPVPTTATVNTPHVKVTKYACTMFGKTMDYFTTGDNVKISLQLEAMDGYTFADEITATLAGAELTYSKVYNSGKTAIVDFAFRVAVPEGGLPYETVKYYVTAPVTGAKPDQIVYRQDPDYVPSGGIKDKYRQTAPPVVTFDWDPADDVFEGGKVYKILIQVKTDDYENPDYTANPRCFNADTKAYVNGVEADITPSVSGKTAMILFTFPATAETVEVPSIEFTKLDFPESGTALDPVAESSTEGVAVDGVTYQKGSTLVTEAAPGDELKVIFSFTLTDGRVLAEGATAYWNDLECNNEYTGGTQKFLPIGSRSYTCAFSYTVPEAAEPEPIKKVDLFAFSQPDAPKADGMLSATAACVTEGVKAVSVAYTKNNAPIATAAPGDEIKVLIDVTLADGYELASGADAVWNGLHCLAEYDGGASHFLYIGPNAVRCCFGYTVPAAETPEPVKYDVTVTDGAASSAKAEAGATVVVVANAAPEGKEFDKWVVAAGTLGDADLTKATLSFTMPASDVWLKATYKDKSAGPVDPATVMLGDVDGNGVIESGDARLALRASVKLEDYQPGTREYIAANVDKDAEISSADARSILRASVHLEDPAAW